MPESSNHGIVETLSILSTNVRSKAHIDNFQVIVVIEQYIGTLEIPVSEPLHMHMADRRKYLPHVIPNN